ncbi:MAG: GTP 3',8-cyclase MoaA [Spirochaetales bacterium]|nr:MAG: GTP 3',8-cyclase MoaA [Spirochaetales bacterium]
MRDLRLSVIDDCNFRCTYCMPREKYGEDFQFLTPEERLTFDEMVRLVGVFAGLGVTKVKLTGGEPLLRPWLPELVERLTAIPGISDIGLITNGYHLEKVALRLKQAGLRRVTVSLDTLDDATWRAINGRGYSVSRVLDGIQAALDAGFSPVKINAVVQRGVNDHQVLDMVERFRSNDYRLRFIEFMDVGTINGWRADGVVTSKELRDKINQVYPISPVDPAYRGEVATRYRFNDGNGEVGFISSVSEPFCQDCTRARLSADGKLFTCLFSQAGHDLRALLRSGASDDEIRGKLATIWGGRDDRYSEERSGGQVLPRMEMFQIGG